jgi:hypothetical protein
VPSLLAAYDATIQIIQLRHFLPLQIPLSGIYSRIFAIIANMSTVYSFDMARLLDGQRTRAIASIRTSPVASLNNENALEHDIGQVVLREEPSVQYSPISTGNTSLTNRPQAEAKVPGIVSDSGVRNRKKARAKGSIDDIFGF